MKLIFPDSLQCYLLEDSFTLLSSLEIIIIEKWCKNISFVAFWEFFCIVLPQNWSNYKVVYF